MTKQYKKMSVADAVYTAARSYPGGIEALAARLDKSPNVLRNKLTSDIDTHHLTLEEALQIIELLDATKPTAAQMAINAIGYRLHRVVVRHNGCDSDDSCVEAQTLAVCSFSGLLAAIVATASMSTGVVRDKRLIDDIESAIARCLDALFLLSDSVERLSEA